MVSIVSRKSRIVATRFKGHLIFGVVIVEIYKGGRGRHTGVTRLLDNIMVQLYWQVGGPQVTHVDLFMRVQAAKFTMLKEHPMIHWSKGMN